MKEKFLSVKDLHVHYLTSDANVYAVNGISFELGRGKTLGLVGETGAGKTTIARAILGILPKPAGRVTSGEIEFEGKSIYKLPEKELQKIRGNKITMIFQDPMTALNPVMTVGEQIAEVVELHNGGDRDAAKKRAVEMLETVGIPAERYSEYPHQFSGGMKQRVVIAIALACSPELLLADEPTTALDVTIQAQILQLLRELKDEYGMAMVLVTHNLGVAAQICDRIAVMYGGHIMELGPTRELFAHPQNPYTRSLLASLPVNKRKGEPLSAIPGTPPNLGEMPVGCPFAPRCARAQDVCFSQPPAEREVGPGHTCRCHFADGPCREEDDCGKPQ